MKRWLRFTAAVLAAAFLFALTGCGSSTNSASFTWFVDSIPANLDPQVASGASDVINCAYVTYANEAKENLVSVSHDTLETKGAVSKETAAEMCLGCAKAAKADIGLSTTGIAGPSGGTKEKPVGLVYLGCSLHEQVTLERHVFSGDREQVRKQAVDAALDLAIRCLDKE